MALTIKTLKISSLGCVALALALDCVSVRAQTQTSSEYAQKEHALPAVLVTATKRTENLQNVPIAITAISGSALKRMSADSFVDYAGSVPGLSFMNLGAGRQTMAIRGINVTGGSATVGYYIGDTPMPTTVPSSGTIVLATVDPKLVDLARIEVLRGPQGTLYGAGSMGGTIRLIPNSPQMNQFTGMVEATVDDVAGGQLGDEVTAILNAPLIADTAALRAVLWSKSGDGFIDRQWGYHNTYPTLNQTLINTVRDVNSEHTNGGRFILKVALGDSADIQAMVYTQHQTFGGFQDYTGGPNNPTGALVQMFLDPVSEPQANDFTLSSVTANYRVGSVGFTGVASYSTGDQLASENSTEAASLFVGDLVGIYDNASEEINRFKDRSLEIRASTLHPIARFDFTAGIFYERNDRWRNFIWAIPGAVSASYGPLPFGGALYAFTDPQTPSSSQEAAFTDVTYHITDRLEATGGVRHFMLKDEQPLDGAYGFASGAIFVLPPTGGEGSLSSNVYKANLSLRATDALRVYASYTQGFRPGDLVPAFASGLSPICQAEIVALGLPLNGIVKPDTTDDYEIGVKWQSTDRRFDWDTSIYDIEWKDIQQTIQLGCGDRVNANAGTARSKGVETELHGQLATGLDVGVSLSALQARIVDPSLGLAAAGDRIQQVPDWTADLHIQQSFSLNIPSLAGSREYVRVDYQDRGSSYYSFLKGLTPAEKNALKLGQLNLLNFRLGLDYGSYSFAFFVKNTLNDVVRTSIENSLAINIPDRPRYVVNYPRTFGVTFAFHW